MEIRSPQKAEKCILDKWSISRFLRTLAAVNFTPLLADTNVRREVNLKWTWQGNSSISKPTISTQEIQSSQVQFTRLSSSLPLWWHVITATCGSGERSWFYYTEPPNPTWALKAFALRFVVPVQFLYGLYNHTAALCFRLQNSVCVQPCNWTKSSEKGVISDCPRGGNESQTRNCRGGNGLPRSRAKRASCGGLRWTHCVGICPNEHKVKKEQEFKIRPRLCLKTCSLSLFFFFLTTRETCHRSCLKASQGTGYLPQFTSSVARRA